ncbi:MAG: hypothetical protein IPL35_05660 [Sphingobacteriales bacterium]|nr:hypothetical protein [Sphingobacteriales bacterium]
MIAQQSAPATPDIQFFAGRRTSFPEFNDPRILHHFSGEALHCTEFGVRIQYNNSPWAAKLSFISGKTSTTAQSNFEYILLFASQQHHLKINQYGATATLLYNIPLNRTKKNNIFISPIIELGIRNYVFNRKSSLEVWIDTIAPLESGIDITKAEYVNYGDTYNNLYEAENDISKRAFKNNGTGIFICGIADPGYLYNRGYFAGLGLEMSVKDILKLVYGKKHNNIHIGLQGSAAYRFDTNSKWNLEYNAGSINNNMSAFTVSLGLLMSFR